MLNSVIPNQLSQEKLISLVQVLKNKQTEFDFEQNLNSQLAAQSLHALQSPALEEQDIQTVLAFIDLKDAAKDLLSFLSENAIQELDFNANVEGFPLLWHIIEVTNHEQNPAWPEMKQVPYEGSLFDHLIKNNIFANPRIDWTARSANKNETMLSFFLVQMPLASVNKNEKEFDLYYKALQQLVDANILTIAHWNTPNGKNRPITAFDVIYGMIVTNITPYLEKVLVIFDKMVTNQLFIDDTIFENSFYLNHAIETVNKGHAATFLWERPEPQFAIILKFIQSKSDPEKYADILKRAKPPQPVLHDFRRLSLGEGNASAAYRAEPEQKYANGM